MDPDGVSQYRGGQGTCNQSWLQMSDVSVSVCTLLQELEADRG